MKWAPGVAVLVGHQAEPCSWHVALYKVADLSDYKICTGYKNISFAATRSFSRHAIQIITDSSQDIDIAPYLWDLYRKSQPSLWLEMFGDSLTDEFWIMNIKIHGSFFDVKRLQHMTARWESSNTAT